MRSLNSSSTRERAIIGTSRKEVAVGRMSLDCYVSIGLWENIRKTDGRFLIVACRDGITTYKAP
jgi:hypothetical protein